MFIGEYAHNLDDKGRIAIPTKFRKELHKGAVITRGLDRCLFLYTLDEWKRMAEKLASLPISKANTRAFARLMLSGAMDVQLDKQGRIVVPPYLSRYASFKRKIVITGLYKRLELWDEDQWEHYKGTTEKESVDIAEALSELDV
ncbi:MAG: division/cell wall cluster transcriptional repressor MraZ [Candidatus Kerfeldbacteria bacterium]|nr:division/cell wall cluster transcriptional repressor MraZ [Candidatus Kerfeldbacteria bacterium]